MIDFNDIDIFLKNASSEEINELSQLIMDDSSSDDNIDESFKFAQDVCDEFLSNGFVLDDSDIDIIAELSLLINKTSAFKERTYVAMLDKFYNPTTITMKEYDKETNKHIETNVETVETIKYNKRFDQFTEKYNELVERYSNTDKFVSKQDEVYNDFILVTKNINDIYENNDLKNKFLSTAEKYKKIYPELPYSLESDKQKFELNYYESIFNEFLSDVSDNLKEVSNTISALEGELFYKDYALISLIDSTKSMEASFVISGLCKRDENGNEEWDFTNFTTSEAWGNQQLVNSFLEFLDRSYKEDGIIPYIQNKKKEYVFPETGERYTVEIDDPKEKNKVFEKSNPFTDKDDSTKYYSTGLNYDAGENLDTNKDNEGSFARSDLLKPKKVRYKVKMMSSNAFSDVAITDKKKLEKYLKNLQTQKKELRAIKNKIQNTLRSKRRDLLGKGINQIQKYIDEGNFSDEVLLELYKKSLDAAGVGTDAESLADSSSKNDERSDIDIPVVQNIYQNYEDIGGEDFSKELDTRGSTIESFSTIQTELAAYLNTVLQYLKYRINTMPKFLKDLSNNYSIVSGGFSTFKENYIRNKDKYEEYRSKISEDNLKFQKKEENEEDKKLNKSNYTREQEEILSVAQTTIKYLSTFSDSLAKATKDVKSLNKKYELPDLDYDKKYIVKVIGDMHDPSFDDFEFNVTVSDIIGDVDYMSVTERNEKTTKTTYFAILAGWRSAVEKTKSSIEVASTERGDTDAPRQVDEQGMQTLHDLQGGHPSQEHEDLMQESRKNTSVLNDLAIKRKELENLLTNDIDDDTKDEINNQLIELDALQEKYSNRNKEISEKLQEMLPKQDLTFTGKSYDAYKEKKLI